MPLQARLVGLGAGVALAVALPAALAAQLADAISDAEDLPAIAYPLVVVVLLAMGLGGWAVARRSQAAALPNAAVAGLVAISVVQLLGIVRRLVADESVAWGSVPVVVVLAVGLACGGAVLGRRAPGRTRP